MVKSKKIARKLPKQIHLSSRKNQLTPLILQKLEEATAQIADKIKQLKQGLKYIWYRAT
jgi:protein-arginine kinase activator protein McsA